MWSMFLAVVAVNWGMRGSQAKKKIRRGKWSHYNLDRKYDSEVSLWGKNAYLLQFPATIWLSLWLLALSAASYLNVGVDLEI